MRHIPAIGLITMLVVVGAFHYPPLWIFVLATPVWMAAFLETEERRVRAETVQRVREHLLGQSGSSARGEPPTHWGERPSTNSGAHRANE